MGFLDFLNKEKREEMKKKENDAKLKNNINAGLNKMEAIFNRAEEEIKCVDDDAATSEIDENSLKDFVTGIWNTVYVNAILSFIGSVEASYQAGKVNETEFSQIRQLLNRWRDIANSHKIDQQHFSDFQDELKQFCEWKVGDRQMFDVFNDNIWKPWFENYSIRAKNISIKYEQFLERKTNKYYLMARTNYAFISPYEFETLVADLFRRMGYEVELTRKSADYGIDVIAKNQKDVIAIQAKKYSKGNNVSNRDVQRLLGAMQLSTVRANKGILITTSDFTVQAKEQAKETPIELWDGEYFNSIMLKYLPRTD